MRRHLIVLALLASPIAAQAQGFEAGASYTYLRTEAIKGSQVEARVGIGSPTVSVFGFAVLPGQTQSEEVAVGDEIFGSAGAAEIKAKGLFGAGLQFRPGIDAVAVPYVEVGYVYGPRTTQAIIAECEFGICDFMALDLKDDFHGARIGAGMNVALNSALSFNVGATWMPGVVKRTGDVVVGQMDVVTEEILSAEVVAAQETFREMKGFGLRAGFSLQLNRTPRY